MKKTLGLAVLLVSLCFTHAAVAGDEVIYRSTNKIDYIKITKAKKEEKEGGLQHPYTFSPDQIRSILRSIKFNKKVMLLKDVENQNLFDEGNVEFLAGHLEEAFKKAKEDQVVVVSYFTRTSHVVIQDDRLTVFRAFVKSDGLHIRFSKIYAKLLGDRTTLGAERVTQEARSLRVSLEVQPGQNRISWDPEELVFDFGVFSDRSAPVAEVKKGAKGKAAKETVPVVTEDNVEEPKKVVKKTKTAEPAPEAASNDPKGVRGRLKELDQLKKDELITDKEYQQKRRELLKEL